MRVNVRMIASQDSVCIMPVMEAAFDPIYGEAWTHDQLLGMMAMPGSWLVALEVAETGDTSRLVGDVGGPTSASSGFQSPTILSKPEAQLIENTGLFVPGSTQIAGFALLRFLLDEAELMLFAVAPAFRRQGLAMHLLNVAITEARGRGTQRIFLEMRADNDPALALYERVGFVGVGVRRSYYKGRDGIARDAVTMACDVEAAWERMSDVVPKV